MGLPAITHLGSWEFSHVLPTSQVGYHAGQPIESVVYCLNLSTFYLQIPKVS